MYSSSVQRQNAEGGWYCPQLTQSWTVISVLTLPPQCPTRAQQPSLPFPVDKVSVQSVVKFIVYL